MDLILHLETFAAVADENSFSRAADELGIAQPLLSRRIRTLEESLGGELFDRSRRQIEITAFGTLLLPHARDLVRRAEQLRAVAQSALASTVRVLGVPPDCDPAALAHVIRAAAEHGLVVSIRELAAQARDAALADGTLTLALVRAAPDTAALEVPLGLASAEPLGRSVHLENLRPRRRAARVDEPPLLVMPEDDLPQVVAALRRAAARAGLPEGRVLVSSSTATALAETIAGTGFLLCPEQLARRHQLAWAPLTAGAPPRRYQLEPDGFGWLLGPLAAAVGAPPPRDAEDLSTRLAVRG
ncbi:LysR family transcriptional regulator [Pseudonocardia spinosispora]|uniref:LysR family transcriptional regulator n=1 Tax=Pseudonocardia spinosispora TaxID=103441 RepID=UPI0003FE1383|nr:LysR family transcriptional regulator [Pseudonocardia spinosispora]